MKMSERPAGSWLGFGLMVACIWLGWEVVKAPLSARAPPAVALRLSPMSPDVLRRSAEIELAAGRTENARLLAIDSLSRAPFNARALRVTGLATAEDGDRDRANTILTLAGNWSLRDDPTHAWLVEERLRQGDYGSAFAHADTLARRRIDLRDTVFNLFTTAATSDPKALPPLAGLVGVSPPWRAAYLEYAQKREGADGVLLALALSLTGTPGPLTPPETEQLYLGWLRENRLSAIRLAREKLGRPPLSEALQDGDFTGAGAFMRPFGWTLETAAGMLIEIAEDDLRKDNNALRVEYSGYTGGILATQMTLLPAGDHLLRGDYRIETGDQSATLLWSLTCFETDAPIGTWTSGSSSTPGSGWRTFSAPVRVPSENCAAQWLRLRAKPGDERARIVAWFDNLNITSPRAVNAR